MRFVDGQGRAENDWLIFFFIYLLLLFVNYRGMLMQIDAFFYYYSSLVDMLYWLLPHSGSWILNYFLLSFK